MTYYIYIIRNIKVNKFVVANSRFCEKSDVADGIIYGDCRVYNLKHSYDDNTQHFVNRNGVSSRHKEISWTVNYYSLLCHSCVLLIPPKNVKRSEQRLIWIFKIIKLKCNIWQWCYYTRIHISNISILISNSEENVRTNLYVSPGKVDYHDEHYDKHSFKLAIMIMLWREIIFSKFLNLGKGFHLIQFHGSKVKDSSKKLT